MTLSGWGNFPRVACRTATVGSADEARAAVRAAPVIARGAGRSYGDASLQPNMTLLTRRLDRLIAFEPTRGRLACEAGVTLATLLEVFLPRGWMVPVTPGTKFATIGGMIAADVHGKNHHVAGSFGRHVEALTLMLADGRVIECGPDRHPDLFAATIGGMGLTGLILAAQFRLQPVETAWMRQETVRVPGLDAAIDAFDESAGWTYSVAWIDCLSGGRDLGRCLLSRGELARLEDLPPALRVRPLSPQPRRPRRVPADFPAWALNRWSVKSFNALYYRLSPRRASPRLVDLDTVFYPLDAILEWNRIYGRHGFTQYQCVLPRSASRPGLDRLLRTIQRAGMGSFLAVLKLFGPQEGMMSFPMEGFTLALDFPVRPPTFALLRELDAIVADHGGRLYLAKDACSTPAMLRTGYPALDQFRDIRDRWGAAGRMQSLQAERLEL